MIGRAAEVAQARAFLEVGASGYFQIVQGFDVVVVLQAAAFEQQDFPAGIGKLAGDGDPGRPAANDTKVAVEFSAIGNLAAVEKAP